MSLALYNISPIDGRYADKTAELQNICSEFGLIHYRVRVEILYFIALSDAGIFKLSAKQKKDLHQVYETFTYADAERIKETEQVTNHDVKAVEYFVKDALSKLKLDKYLEFVHFGLTSQDINNTAMPMLWRDALYIIATYIEDTLADIHEIGWANKKVSMLARTHGQSASPTTLGKELLVFVERLQNQLVLLKQIPFAAKFGGATGNFNAHIVAYPKIDWVKFGNNFVNNTLGLQRMQYTTQIEHYDMLAAQCDTLKRINNILIDYARDVWQYISMDYFTQALKANEVGSSAMPHKVNPIDFENAEGNLGMANAILEHLAAKLPISRLQRDLTDSTVLRNIGVPLGHILIALKSLAKGNGKLVVNTHRILEDLNNNWAVISEAIQTILRRENYPKPYEALKALTRGNKHITKESIHSFIDDLQVSVAIKKELKNITPENYIGNAGAMNKPKKK
jgi:adenylosuccinate lyase